MLLSGRAILNVELFDRKVHVLNLSVNALQTWLRIPAYISKLRNTGRDFLFCKHIHTSNHLFHVFPPHLCWFSPLLPFHNPCDRIYHSIVLTCLHSWIDRLWAPWRWGELCHTDFCTSRTYLAQVLTHSKCLIRWNFCNPTVKIHLLLCIIFLFLFL